MIANFSIIPIGKGESLSADIAKVYKLTEESGLPYEKHSMGTNVEGGWRAVMKLFNQCRKMLLKKANRVSILIHIDDRKGLMNRMAHKVASAEAKM